MASTRLLWPELAAMSDPRLSWAEISRELNPCRDGPTPIDCLTALFERTDDGHVAFALGEVFEQMGAQLDAIAWYRRAQEQYPLPAWQGRAEEAADRLELYEEPADEHPGSYPDDWDSSPGPEVDDEPLYEPDGEGWIIEGDPPEARRATSDPEDDDVSWQETDPWVEADAAREEWLRAKAKNSPPNADKADELLERVLEFRRSGLALSRPYDVEHLRNLFPTIELPDGQALDYHEIDDGNASWIEVFLRPATPDAGYQTPPPRGLVPLADRYRIMGYRVSPDERRREVVELLNPLWLAQDDGSPWRHAAFEYAFFVTELGSFRARWHAAEWTVSTPVFSEKRFRALVDEAGPQAVLRYEPPTDYAPRVTSESDGVIRVRFLVFSPVGTRRIYVYWCRIEPDGFVTAYEGQTVVSLGPGFVF